MIDNMIIVLGALALLLVLFCGLDALARIFNWE